jgi:serine phosphatase RsbU (regulator of sigma subunit)
MVKPFNASKRMYCCILTFSFLCLSPMKALAGQPPHTSFSEIFKGSGDEGIVCYKEKHRNFFFITFGLVSLLGLLTFNRYQIKKRSSRVLEDKNKIIEEKNKDIVDSINYARRIQQALLPDEQSLQRILPDSFLLFQPKDIVSGDFYWIAGDREERIVVVADSTGHGVPGAFMSMIGHAFLNEIVLEKGITEPAVILNLLREKIITALKQGDASESRDGMDVTIVRLKQSGEAVDLQFAGANNPLWIWKGGALTEVKGDKQPVGVWGGSQQPFTNHSFRLEKGNQLYLFTDGYADQFGGNAGKKFRYKAMQELISEMASVQMSRQKEILAERLRQWKGALEQVDDILVLGIRL